MKKVYFLLFHILDLNLKISYQIASLFHMYIDMGERIAGEQDMPSLIIASNSQKYKKITFWSIYEKLALNCFPLHICLHCDEVCIC